MPPGLPDTPRQLTRVVNLGPLRIGGGNPVVVQSMTNTDTRHVESTLEQIHQLHAQGCEVVRVAVPDAKAAQALRYLQEQSPLPLVADIHFDHRLAIMALEAGIPGLRINPGNIGGKDAVDSLADAAIIHHATIRVGVNSGSVEKDLLQRFGGPTPEAMVESALAHARLLEDRGFGNIKISIKSSQVLDTVTACRLLAQRADYPQHLGITEAGGLVRGTVKSAVGLGLLLFEGIGDTLRVSLTAHPVEEMAVAWEILRSVGLRQRGVELISCPTCGRTEIDLLGMARKVEEATANCPIPLKIAVMGCVVNGPGEAREADLGLAGGRGKGVIFKKGQVLRSVHGEEALLQNFLHELELLIQEHNNTH